VLCDLMAPVCILVSSAAGGPQAVAEGSYTDSVLTEHKRERQASRFLGALAKLRKVTISFVMSVCPSVRMEQLVSHWTDCH